MIKKETIQQIAQELSISEGAIWAIVSTESSGAFSWGNGKIPILLERHWVYRLAKNKFGWHKAKQLAKSFPDICNPKPGGYGAYSKQYKRLAKAIRVIDSEIAHQATSFGAFQIMGFNHKIAGFASATAMSDAFHQSADEQVKGFMVFVTNYKKGQILEALKRFDWKEAARLYNGKNYKINRYDSKMLVANEAYVLGEVQLS